MVLPLLRVRGTVKFVKGVPVDSRTLTWSWTKVGHGFGRRRNRGVSTTSTFVNRNLKHV